MGYMGWRHLLQPRLHISNVPKRKVVLRQALRTWHSHRCHRCRLEPRFLVRGVCLKGPSQDHDNVGKLMPVNYSEEKLSLSILSRYISIFMFDYRVYIYRIYLRES